MPELISSTLCTNCLTASYAKQTLAKHKHPLRQLLLHCLRLPRDTMPPRKQNSNELHSRTTQAATLVGQKPCCTQPNDDKTTDRRTEEAPRQQLYRHYTTNMCLGTPLRAVCFACPTCSTKAYKARTPPCAARPHAPSLLRAQNPSRRTRPQCLANYCCEQSNIYTKAATSTDEETQPTRKRLWGSGKLTRTARG